MTEIDIASDQEQQSVEARPPLISSWNPNREPCRSCTTINLQREPPEKLTAKGAAPLNADLQ